MKNIFVAGAIALITATSANAGGEMEGNFEGGVFSSAATGGFSASAGGFDNGKSSIRNESAAGQFAGSSMKVEFGDSDGAFEVKMQGQSHVEGFDTSKTISKDSGFGTVAFGGSTAIRDGVAWSGGTFEGSFEDTFGTAPGNGNGNNGCNGNGHINGNGNNCSN